MEKYLHLPTEVVTQATFARKAILDRKAVLDERLSTLSEEESQKVKALSRKSKKDFAQLESAGLEELSLEAQSVLYQRRDFLSEIRKAQSEYRKLINPFINQDKDLLQKNQEI